MVDPLDIIADLLIQNYSPIGAIQHKYITKVTAIGLLKSVNITQPDYYKPYYDRLKSYKLLVQNLMDNFKMSNIVALKIFFEIVIQIATDPSILPEDRYKSPEMLNLLLILEPKLAKSDSATLLQMSKNFYQSLTHRENVEKVATKIIDQHLSNPDHYDIISEKIVKKCLTEVKQEEVLERLENAIYNFFIYAYFDERKRQLRYEITYKHNKNIESLEPFFHLKMLARSIISTVGTYKTTANFFGDRIDTYEEIKGYFSKTPNVMVMFF